MTEEVRETKSERMIKLWTKIFNVQNSCNTNLEEDKGNKLQWKPVAHWKVTGAVKAACKAHNLLCMPIVEETTKEGQTTTATVSLVLTDIETGEQTVVGKFVGYGVDSMDKGAGKAVSYAIKTAMLKTFMMNVADDNEPDVIQSACNYLLESLQQENIALNSPIKTRKDWLDKNDEYIKLFRQEYKDTAKDKRPAEQDILAGLLSKLPIESEDTNAEES